MRGRSLGRLAGMLGVLLLPLRAQIRIPSSVYRLADVEAAAQKAVSEQELLVFIMVNPSSAASHVATAFEEYHKKFRGFGPVVLVPQGVNSSLLPAGAVRGFAQLSGGYPRLVVVDPVNGELVEAVPYTRVSERARALRAHRSAVGRYQREQRAARRRQPPRLPPTPVPPTPVPPAPVPPPADADPDHGSFFHSRGGGEQPFQG